MDHDENEFQEGLRFTFADIVHLIKKNKRFLQISAVLCAASAIFYGLSKPIEYHAEATFKEKAKSQSGIGSSLSVAFLMMADNVESNALTMLRSRKLIEDLIKSRDLQGVVVKKEDPFPLPLLENIRKNWLTEYALFKRIPTTVLTDPKKTFNIQNIVYNSEVPKIFKLGFSDQNQFILYDLHGQKIGDGEFGIPFSQEDYTFTLLREAPPPLNEEYIIALLPLEQTAQLLSKKFTIETDKNDKSLIKISYSHPDRQEAVNNVNALMTLYQKHVTCDHEKICERQVSYLMKRQEEMASVLKNMMQAHANTLSSDLSSTGFATSEKAMDFLAHTQQELKRKLFAINLEVQRLKETNGEISLNSDVFSTINNLDVINKISTEKRLLKQQADSLNLVLRNHPSQSKEFQESFEEQLEDLEVIKQTLKESNASLISLEKNEIPSSHPILSDSSKYVFNEWLKRLANAGNHLKALPNDSKCLENWRECKTGLTSYLSNLNHFLNVYQRNIEEKLSHQQAPLKEFQGINLNIARELYISYNKDLSQAESLATQHEFVLNQLDEPDFEMSSLTTILSDPLSLDMISRTSELILALKDQDNRTSKEKERLLADIAIQKGFLKTHIQQSISLLGLRQNFLQEKIHHLQNLNLSLIQEEISILENQLTEYISSALENLIQEKLLIEKNLSELRVEMAALPQKWAAEQMIEQQMKINKSLVEEISKLVESKNISNNLEKFQSSPLDRAFLPIHPKSPRLLLLAFMGASIGAFLGLIWILGSSIVKGIQASAENLAASGQQVCGFLSRTYKDSLDKNPLTDNDLATLRRLIAFMDPQKQDQVPGNTLLLLEGKGPDYGAPLAELLSKKGLKTMILELRFDQVQEGKAQGILQYLEGKIEFPAILHCAEYDKIPSGGICRYANELIGSQRFKDLLHSLTKQYEWVIVSSSASPTGAEAESLLDLFSFVSVTVSGESLHDLKNCISYSNFRKGKMAFVMS